MKKLTIISVIFLGFLFCSLLYIGYNIKQQNLPYKAYEHDMEEATKTYIMTNKIIVNVGTTHKLELEKMLSDGMMATNKVNEDVCDGYVNIKRTVSGYEYTPYIKCKNYETITN